MQAYFEGLEIITLCILDHSLSSIDFINLKDVCDDRIKMIIRFSLQKNKKKIKKIALAFKVHVLHKHFKCLLSFFSFFTSSLLSCSF